MAKAVTANPKKMTKSQIAQALADMTGITKKQASAFMVNQAELAYREAKNGFAIPGIGKLVLVNRQARMGRNPRTNEPIQIAVKRAVKFRIVKAAKVAILGATK
jgi:DNA-binding protein HU-beta